MYKILNKYGESSALPLGLTFTKNCLPLNRAPMELSEKILGTYGKDHNYLCFTVNPDPFLFLGKNKNVRYYKDLTVDNQRQLIKRRCEIYFNYFENKFKIKGMYNYFELTKNSNVHLHTLLIFQKPVKHELQMNDFISKQTMKYFHSHMGRPKVDPKVCCTVSKCSNIYDDLEGLISWIDYITKVEGILAPYKLSPLTTGIISIINKESFRNEDCDNEIIDEDYYNFIINMNNIDYEGIDTLLK